LFSEGASAVVYLLTSHVWWVLAALALGVGVGWSSCRHEPRMQGLGWLALAGGAVAVAAGVAALMLLNGAAARWLETALLLVAAYAGGACIGCVLHGLISAAPAVAVGRSANPGSVQANGKPIAAARPPVVKPYVWRATKDNAGLTLAGHVPSEDVRGRLLDVAKASLPLPLTDTMQLGSGAPGGLDAMAGAAFRHLDILSAGSATVTGTRYALVGSVPDRATYDAVVEAVRQLPAGFTLAKLDIPAPPAAAHVAAPAPVAAAEVAEPAVVTPAVTVMSGVGKPAAAASVPAPAVRRRMDHHLALLRDSKVITMSGVLPTAQARADVIAALRSRDPLLPIVDFTQLSPGARPEFSLAARMAGFHVARLNTGRATLSSSRYGVEGVVRTVADLDAVIAGSRALPAGMSLARADVIVLPVAKAPSTSALKPVLATPPPPPRPPAAPISPSADIVTAGSLDGSRPAGLDAPRGGRADDLKRIRGIGKQNEGRLHGLGIWHFDQIAAWSAEEAKWVGSYLAFPGRIEREDWINQAKELASGRETAFSRRAALGDVPTSRDTGDLGQDNVEGPAGGKPSAKQ
jgi:predicted flap endonuclease-1-like 5' DNA nuclease